MGLTKVLTRVLTLPILGAILWMAGGCGSDRTIADTEPDLGAKRKQARIDAYGQRGVELAKGKPGGSRGGQQGARRAGR